MDVDPALHPITKQEAKLELARIADWEVRAKACSRAGRSRSEANAFFCMGVLYDSIRQHREAVECYERFRAVLKPRADQFAEALAHNSIGVSYQYLQEYEKALFHHESHRDVSDLPGQFIALTNMGCVYLKLDKPRHAEHHLKQALAIASQLGSVTGQTIALALIGSVTSHVLTRTTQLHLGGQASPKHRSPTHTHASADRSLSEHHDTADPTGYTTATSHEHVASHSAHGPTAQHTSLKTSPTRAYLPHHDPTDPNTGEDNYDKAQEREGELTDAEKAAMAKHRRDSDVSNAVVRY